MNRKSVFIGDPGIPAPRKTHHRPYGCDVIASWAVNRSVLLTADCCYSVLPAVARNVWRPKTPIKVYSKLEKVAIIAMYCHLRLPDAIAVATWQACSVFYFTCNHVLNWYKIIPATEGVLQLFHNYFNDNEHVGKYSWAAISLWNNCEIILFHM